MCAVCGCLRVCCLRFPPGHDPGCCQVAWPPRVAFVEAGSELCCILSLHPPSAQAHTRTGVPHGLCPVLYLNVFSSGSSSEYQNIQSQCIAADGFGSGLPCKCVTSTPPITQCVSSHLSFVYLNRDSCLSYLFTFIMYHLAQPFHPHSLSSQLRVLFATVSSSHWTKLMQSDKSGQTNWEAD